MGHYVRSRPGYPPGVLEVLRRETGLAPEHVVADVGSGTGISTLPFLENGNAVLAVEPNDEMRGAAEESLAAHPRFRSVAGTAEDTTLPDAGVDYVVAGQAFHWFDVPRARAEFRRILRPGGWVVLLWNSRRVDSTPFLRAYEEMLVEHGTDYMRVNHQNIAPEAIAAFYGGPHALRKVPNEQVFDLEGLRARVLSSSYTPDEGHPGHAAMMRTLDRIFREHAEDGVVRFEYDTEVWFGRLA
ncbi:MAG TPA: methyltransferase domain-containing protein [Longimicrobium sp.]|nr:methyltransferase domain-containing protein [Longimicrobium sp.]